MNSTVSLSQSASTYKMQKVEPVELWYRIILILIIVLSVPLNMMVLVRITRYKTSSQRKKTPKEILIASMAASDILQASVGYVLQYIAIEFEKLSSTYCQMSGFFITFFALTSMNHVIALSIDSYLHICKPWFTEKCQSIGNRLHVIYPALSCLYAFIWAVVPLIGWGEYGMIEGGNCSIEWNTNVPHKKGYIISMLVCCFLLPVSTMITFFALTQMGLSKMRGFAVERFGSRSVVVLHNKQAEKSNLKTCLFIAVTFIFVWTPYSIFAILQVLGYDVRKTQTRQTLLDSAALLAKSSVIYNPIFYTLRSESFRAEVAQIYEKASSSKWQFFRITKDLKLKKNLQGKNEISSNKSTSNIKDKDSK